MNISFFIIIIILINVEQNNKNYKLRKAIKKEGES